MNGDEFNIQTLRNPPQTVNTAGPERITAAHMPDCEPLSLPREGDPGGSAVQPGCSGRRHPRLILSSPSSCLSCAVHHVQETRRAAETWCQQAFGRFQSHLDPFKTSRFFYRDSDCESVMSAQLSVEGVSISARETTPSCPLARTLNDVLAEVLHLVERLEADRQVAQDALAREKRRRQFLQSELEQILQRRQRELMTIEEREHEASKKEISELKFQLKLDTEKYHKIQEKLSNKELQNQLLHQDTNFSSKQIPVVKENLKLESGNRSQIDSAKSEAEEVYSKTENELSQAERDFKAMEVEADKEKTSQEKIISAKKTQQGKRLEDLKQLKTTEESLSREIEQMENALTLSQKESAIRNQRIPEIKEQENTERDTISSLYLQFETNLQTNKTLQEKLILLQENLERTKLKAEADVSRTEAVLQSKRSIFSDLRRENLQLEAKVEELRNQMCQSERAVKQMREERRRMIQEISANDEQWENAKDELIQVSDQQGATQEELEEQERDSYKEEQEAQKLLETLKKDLIGHRTTQQNLKRACGALEVELERFRTKWDVVNKTLLKDFRESSSAWESLQRHLEEMQTLSGRLENMQHEHNDSFHGHQRRKIQEQEQLEACRDLSGDLSQRFQLAEDRISQLLKENEEFQEDSEKTEKMIEQMPEEIQNLQSDVEMLKFKETSASFIRNSLETQIQNLQLGKQQTEKILRDQLVIRRKLLQETQASLSSALEENVQLGKKFRNLQNILKEEKQKTVKIQSQKTLNQQEFYHYTQLFLFQRSSRSLLRRDDNKINKD